MENKKFFDEIRAELKSFDDKVHQNKLDKSEKLLQEILKDWQTKVKESSKEGKRTICLYKFKDASEDELMQLAKEKLIKLVAPFRVNNNASEVCLIVPKEN